MRASITFALILASSSAYALSADCLFEISGRAVIDGSCNYLPTGGDFQVSSEYSKAEGYVERQGDGSHRLSWNQGAENKLLDLGPVKRRGACWQNSASRLCAWKLSEFRYFEDERGRRISAPRTPPASYSRPDFQTKSPPQKPTVAAKTATDAAAISAITFAPLATCISLNRSKSIIISKTLNPPESDGGVLGVARFGVLATICEKEANSALAVCESDLNLSSTECTIIAIKISERLMPED